MNDDYFGMDAAFPEFVKPAVSSQTTIAQLARDMGQKESDVIAFVNCLRVWTDKGFTLEEAIVRHEQQMAELVSGVYNMPTEDKKAFVVDTFFPE